MTNYNVCLLAGDGIGPEILAEGVKVLDAVGAKYNTRFTYTECLLGGAAIEAQGTPYPQETKDLARAADAVLLAAVGGPQWDSTDSNKPRPEQGLLGIRKDLGLYTNLRPVRTFSALAGSSPLKHEVVKDVDLVIVRELCGGLYFGERGRFFDEAGCGTGIREKDSGAGGSSVGTARGQRAFDTLEYCEYEIERIAHRAFALARSRRGCLHSIDKANILETGRLWREIVHSVATEYPDVELHDMLVDNAAMQLISNPHQFDVLVTENTFGDILSDEAAMLAGSLGMLASASLGDGTALYEPSHGSAPDIAGQNVANPLAQILSVGLMLRYSFHLYEAAADITRAITAVLQEGWRTRDLAQKETPNDYIIGTSEMGDKVVAHL